MARAIAERFFTAPFQELAASADVRDERVCVAVNHFEQLTNVLFHNAIRLTNFGKMARVFFIFFHFFWTPRGTREKSKRAPAPMFCSCARTQWKL